MAVYGCTVNLKAEVLPELKLTGHKCKKKKAKAILRATDTNMKILRCRNQRRNINIFLSYNYT
jgi:hypothetical protein